MSAPTNLVNEVEVSAFAHATEEEVKVEKAIRNILHEEARSIRLTRRKLSGYYGDPITIIKGKMKKKEATKVLENILRRLSTLDKQRLLDESEDRLDDGGNLYVRLDKQKAYLGMVSLQETDPVRVIFKLRMPYTKERAGYVQRVIDSMIKEEDTQL